MFDGVADEPHELHQFIVSSLPLPLSSFPDLLHPSPNINNYLISSSLYPYYSHVHQLPFQSHDLSYNQFHQQQQQSDDHVHNTNLKMVQTETKSSSIPQHLLPINDQQTASPWSNEELLSFLRITSDIDCFPEFTWEYVSRKLAELGFVRSAEKCKQKFEDETRYFNHITLTNNLTEVEELYNNHAHETPDQNPLQVHPSYVGAEKETQKVVIKNASGQDKRGYNSNFDQDCSTRNEDKTVLGKDYFEDNYDGKVMMIKERTKINTKRKRQNDKFEMLKGLCEDIVKKMMAQQEQIHNKLVENMVKKDKENVEKEEAWKKLKIDWMNKELDIMAKEQAIVGDRQITIIQILKKFTSSLSSSLPKSQSSKERSL